MISRNYAFRLTLHPAKQVHGRIHLLSHKQPYYVEMLQAETLNSLCAKVVAIGHEKNKPCIATVKHVGKGAAPIWLQDFHKKEWVFHL